MKGADVSSVVVWLRRVLSLGRRRWVVLVVFVGVVVAGFLAIVFLLKPFAFMQGPAQTPPRLVGGHRYIAACQALPIADVERIFGALQPTGTVSDTMHAASYTAEELAGRPLDATCEYMFNDTAGRAFRVVVSQFAEESDAQNAWKAKADLGSGEARARMERLEKDLQAVDQNDPLTASARELLQVIKSAQPELERASGGKNVEGLDASILYVPGTGEFVGLHKNALLTMSYKSGGAFSYFADATLTAEEFVKLNGRMKQAFDRAYANVDAAQLPQSLSSAVISDDKTAYGARLVDPCRVFTADGFRAIYEVSPDRKVTQRSFLRQATASGANSVTKELTYTNAVCDYTGKEQQNPTETVTVSFVVEYCPSVTDAQAAVADSAALTPSEKERYVATEPATQADAAVIITNKGTSGIKLAHFRYKSISMQLELFSSTGFVPSDAQVVSGINAAVAELRRSL